MSTDENDRPDRKIGRPADAAKREAMLAAASTAFFHSGYAATSIEQVAADAGVSKVTIYNHFSDKSGLFTAAVEHECAKLSGHFSIDQMHDGTLEDRFAQIGTAMGAFLSRPEMIQFERRIAAETEHNPALGIAFLDAGPRQMKAQFTRLLERLVAEDELVIADPALAAEQFVGMCKGLGDLERRFGASHDAARDRERIAGAVTVFLAAYRPQV
ncbi:MAG: TetR/AcrR family transcriptional regulator [Pontixanthobacter sp.]